MTKKGWIVPSEGPETNTEVLRNEKAKKNSKSELVQNRLSDETIDNADDTALSEKSGEGEVQTQNLLIDSN